MKHARRRHASSSLGVAVLTASLLAGSACGADEAREGRARALPVGPGGPGYLLAPAQVPPQELPVLAEPRAATPNDPDAVGPEQPENVRIIDSRAHDAPAAGAGEVQR